MEPTARKPYLVQREPCPADGVFAMNHAVKGALNHNNLCDGDAARVRHGGVEVDVELELDKHTRLAASGHRVGSETTRNMLCRQADKSEVERRGTYLSLGLSQRKGAVGEHIVLP